MSLTGMCGRGRRRLTEAAGKEGSFDVHLERVQGTGKEAMGVPGRGKVGTKPETWTSLVSWRNEEEFKGTGTVSEGQPGGGWKDERWEDGSWVRKNPVGWALRNMDLIFWAVERQDRDQVRLA